jgi:hypothetical protein
MRCVAGKISRIAHRPVAQIYTGGIISSPFFPATATQSPMPQKDIPAGIRLLAFFPTGFQDRPKVFPQFVDINFTIRAINRMHSFI